MCSTKYMGFMDRNIFLYFSYFSHLLYRPYKCTDGGICNANSVLLLPDFCTHGEMHVRSLTWGTAPTIPTYVRGKHGRQQLALFEVGRLPSAPTPCTHST